MTETCGEGARPTIAEKGAADRRDTVFVLAMFIVTTATFAWYFVKLALGDAEGAGCLVPLVIILFFSLVGFDEKKRTTSPAVHALVKVDWALMAVCALTMIVPMLFK